MGPWAVALSRVNNFCLLGMTLCLCTSGIEALTMTNTTRNCSDGKWSCHDGRRCIWNQYVCNGRIHCTDGSDEKPDVCALWQCSKGMWKCGDNICINDEYICDANPSSFIGNCITSKKPVVLKYCNCRDGSDEQKSVCSEWNCTDGYWKCPRNNRCIPNDRVCDGYGSCGDWMWSDEDPVICSTWNCSSGYWKCEKANKCIQTRWVCDGTSECPGEDEEPELCQRWNCSSGLWKCMEA